MIRHHSLWTIILGTARQMLPLDEQQQFCGMSNVNHSVIWIWTFEIQIDLDACKT